MDDEYLCSAFIRGLHPLFSTLIEAYDNNLMGDRPIDVNSAYQMATRWKTVKFTKNTYTAGDATVFVTTLASTKRARGGGRGSRDNRGGGRGGQRGRGQRSHQEEKKEDDRPMNDITDDAWRALTRPPRGSCFKCWRRGHFVGECPNDFHPNYNHREADDTIAFPMIALSAGSGIFDQFELGLDTLSDINVIHDLELGWNYRKARTPINVVGINGAQDPTSLDTICDTAFGPAYLGPVNVVSAGAAWENGWSRIRDDWHDEEVMQKDRVKLYFTRRRGRNVYTADGSQLIYDQNDNAEAVHDTESYRSLGITTRPSFPTFETVQDVERVYNNRELARAREARALFKMLGYPSATNLIKLVRHGKIRDNALTTKDIINCIHIYGPDLARIRGMSTRARRPFESQDLLGKYIDEDITLDVDVMFCEGVPFLLGVVTPLELVLAHYLKSRSLNQVRSGILDFSSQISKLGFRMRQLRCDGEGAVSAIANEVNATVIDQTGSDTHLGTVDAAIKKVKNVVRGHLAISPFQFPFMLIVFLIFYAVSRVNFWPTSTYPGCVTPMELAYGRQFYAPRDGPCYFTERVEVQERTSNSISAPRTRPGLWVGSVGNQSHSQRVLMLDTLKTKKVDQLRPLPMDHDTIARINNIASNDRRKVRLDPEFRRGNIVITFEDQDADITSQMLELNLRHDSHPIQPSNLPDHFPLDAQGQANYLDPTAGSSRRSDVVAVDELITAPSENESEPAPPPAEAPNIFQPAQAIPAADITAEGAEGEATTAEEPIESTNIEQEIAVNVEQSPQDSAIGQDHEEHDLADLYDPIADPQDEPEPPDPLPQPANTRYNLRPRRSRQDALTDNQRFRDYEVGLHISVTKARNLYGQAAEESMLSELTKLHRKNTMLPVDVVGRSAG